MPSTASGPVFSLTSITTSETGVLPVAPPVPTTAVYAVPKPAQTTGRQQLQLSPVMFIVVTLFSVCTCIV